MSVFAYLDPGTGSLIMQALLAGAAGVAVLWKTTAQRFRSKPAEDAESLVEEASQFEEPVADQD
jgi:hypothetical protein